MLTQFFEIGGSIHGLWLDWGNGVRGATSARHPRSVDRSYLHHNRQSVNDGLNLVGLDEMHEGTEMEQKHFEFEAVGVELSEMRTWGAMVSGCKFR